MLIWHWPLLIRESDMSNSTTSQQAGQGRPSLTQRQIIWRRFKRHRLGVIGTVIVLLLSLIAVFADFLSPYTYDSEHRTLAYAPPTPVHFFDENGASFRPFIYAYKQTRDPISNRVTFSEETDTKYYLTFFAKGDPYKLLGLFETDVHFFGVQTPSDSKAQLFLFGSDTFGRDLLSRILFGARVSMAIGPVSIVFSLFLGALFGGLSGFYGGWIDMIIQRIIEILQSFPALPLFLALSATLPSHWSSTAVFFGIVLIFSLIGWTGLARVLRGQILSLRESEYVLAAKAMGTKNLRIIFKHLLPNTLTTVIVTATLGIPGAIMGESALSFLGLGIRDPMTSWGLLLFDFLSSMMTNLRFHPWLMIPGVFIIVAVLAYNFMGDALRDAADPFSNN